MTKRESKSQPSWTDVKAKLVGFDRTAVGDLLHHLYAAHKDNQAFLHARFGLGEDVLELYKNHRSMALARPLSVCRASLVSPAKHFSFILSPRGQPNPGALCSDLCTRRHSYISKGESRGTIFVGSGKFAR